jgi:hypothetical protein
VTAKAVLYDRRPTFSGVPLDSTVRTRVFTDEILARTRIGKALSADVHAYSSVTGEIAPDSAQITPSEVTSRAVSTAEMPNISISALSSTTFPRGTAYFPWTRAKITVLDDFDGGGG